MFDVLDATGWVLEAHNSKITAQKIILNIGSGRCLAPPCIL